ncbi:cytosolic Fe-S cluster assembly factor NUBP2 homolog [Cyclospora cayetanensis]|uniref:Cytosolic Fe-S cluster assembly factor NUBP2 homolog n=1 Tax=Cyclospora cayetanensis TaxID=88456 RepID=A0A6P6RUW0_9EIME|nr:cytosolic Fe-S cluster assembly factor NUBP2 homolog [Cyclospora cayetanensis]
MAGISRGRVAAFCAASAAVGAALTAAALLCFQHRIPSQRPQGGGTQRERLEEEEEEAQKQEISASCPGPESAVAGLAAGCEGCPGRSLCLAAKGVAAAPNGAAASGAPEEASRDTAATTGLRQPKNAEIAAKLRGVRKKIVVLSGKGGVGKSTVASQLGWTLNSLGFSVGLCDLDLCGPSLPLMLRQKTAEVFQSAEGWEPAFVREDLCLMSIGFLLPEEDSAVIWRGPKKNLLIKTFLSNVNWGELDFLIVDTPPGTSDEHISLTAFLDADGAIVVTTPQEAALQDVRKQINFCRKVSLPVLGVVENMTSSVFAEGPNVGGAEVGVHA